MRDAPIPAVRFLAVLVAGLFAVGFLRVLAVWAHEPLYAYANSYDQTRYTACFDIYPDRPAEVPPAQNSPLAPYTGYRFIAGADPMCYWSSELVFGAATATIWRGLEAAGGEPVHSVRLVGALRIAALVALVAAFIGAAWRRRKPGMALAHALLFAVLLSDPGNTLYLNTFYAEWTALLGAYALFGSLMLWRDEAFARWPALCVALAALCLATSKIQHLLLPAALAGALIALAWWQRRRVRWPVLALAVGASTGALLQVAQLTRGGDMMDSIRQYNRADVVFTALLPLADDKPAFLERIGIDPRCAEHVGKNAWMLPDMPERSCPGVLAFGYADELGVLLTHPLMSLRLGGRAVLALSPWLAANIGHVEGQEMGRLPLSMPSIGHLLAAAPAVQWVLLALPLAALLVLVWWRRADAAPDLAVLVVASMLATLGITVLGDGLADTAKQGHLVVNSALAWCIVVWASWIGSASRAPHRAPRAATA